MVAAFVSCENIDAPWAAAFVGHVRVSGFRVEHSPRNPAYGPDERWQDWYQSGLSAALDSAEYFVIVLTRGWESSTWMGEESQVAEKRVADGRLRGMYYFDPEHVVDRGIAAGMRTYLRIRLPDTPQEAAAYLKALREATS